MKKLFSIFFVLALIWSTTALAQTMTVSNFAGNSKYGTWGDPTVACYLYKWNTNGSNPTCMLVVSFLESEGVTYGGRVYPPKGSYPISATESDGTVGRYQNANSYDWVYNSSRKYSVWVNSSGTQICLWNGTWMFDEGDGGPYVHSTTTIGLSTNKSSANAGSAWLNCGVAATYYYPTIQSNDNAMGTVTSTYKSGYVYENDRSQEYKKNSVYTISATPKPGYRFVSWSDGGAQTHDITITGNTTYTATFEAEGGVEYTISTAVSPSNTYGTVTGAGDYFENTNATLTAISANEHLYIFDHWLKDGNNYAGGTTITPTVTANATYTAVFRAAAAGTITGVAAHGTISGTGNYAGGTAVQLGVTAADGYVFTQWTDGNTDNPRTVYVDGNATYTAQFVQGVNVNVPHSVLTVYDGSGNELEVGAGSYFNVKGNNGEYSFIIESASTAFSATTFNYNKLEQNSTYTWLKRNGSNVALDYTKSSITFTQTEYYNYHQTYNVSATLVGTDGTRYQISTVASRFVYFDTDDDYAFPYMDYNFAAPSFRESIPEDYNPGAWSYNAGSKWLYLKTTLSGSDYYIRLAFNVTGSSIPTGTYTLGTSNSASLISNYATPVYGLVTDCGWPQEVQGSNVFAWGDDAYWWFFHSGTINVVNTNGVYYVEVDAYNTRAQNIRFTMGTRPVVSYNLAWDANGGELSGTYTAAGSVNEGTSITAPTATRTGYTFTGWSPAFTGTMPAANTTYTAQWTANTYNVSFAPNGGSGTMTDQVFTYGEAQNLKANTFTAPTATVTYNYNGATGNNSPASETVHALFSNWTDGVNNYADEAEVNNLTATNGATVAMTANWSWTEEITLPTPTKTGYEFDQWSFNMGGMDLMEDAGAEIAIEEDVEMTALWNIVTYDLTYNGLEGATNSNPETYTIESETITLVAPGKRSGYVFTGWTLGDSPITEIVSGSTGNKTLTATWEEMPSEIVLEDNRENSFYDTFKKKYDGAEDITVVYNRQFPKSKWATLCLPFVVNSALLNSLDMAGRVYEFKKAEGNAETGINLYFATAETIIAGKGYIVNANAKLAAKSSFRFPEVKINLESDKGDELNSQESYDALEGTSTEGSDIELVGTLRKGRLRGVEDGKNRYMGLKDNKIYYPNISTEEGSLILAYRGIFRFRSIDDTLNAERIRIVVDGEDMGELLIENDGRMTIDNDATRKFVKDGVLYIEREGVIYDAQGKRIK